MNEESESGQPKIRTSKVQDATGKDFSKRDYFNERKQAHQASRDKFRATNPKIARSGQFGTKDVTMAQWLWLVCHFCVVIGTVMSVFYRLTFQLHTFWPRLYYRGTLIAAVGAYTTSLIHSLNGDMPSFYALLPVQTFQFLMLAVVWLISPSHTTKLLPFLAYSLLHVVDFHCRYVSKSGPLGTTLSGLMDKYSYRLAKISSFFEFHIFLILVFDLLRLRSSSLPCLLFYAFYFRIKLLYSPSTQETMQDIWLFVDGELSKPKRPAKIREAWVAIKDNLQNHSSHAKKIMRQEEEDAIKEQNAEAK